MADDPRFTTEQKVTLGLTVLDLVCYTPALLVAVCNTVKFLFIDKKYKNIYLSAFYILTILTLGLRIVFFCSFIVLLLQGFSELNAAYFTWVITRLVSFHTKVILELFQTTSMVQFAIHTKLSAKKLSLTKAEN